MSKPRKRLRYIRWERKTTNDLWQTDWKHVPWLNRWLIAYPWKHPPSQATPTHPSIYPLLSTTSILVLAGYLSIVF